MSTLTIQWNPIFARLEMDAERAYLRACVTIDQTDITAEYCRLASDYAYWNERYAESMLAVSALKQRSAKLRAELRDESVAFLTAAGKKTTERAIEAEVDRADEWGDHQAQVYHAEAAVRWARGILDAVRAKKDMLVSLGAHARQERDADGLG